MRYLSSVCISIFLLWTQGIYAAEMRTFKVGAWHAGAYTSSSSREFSHCAATAGYKSGIWVTFSISRNFVWSMGFSNPAWKLVPGSEFDIGFTVDDMSPIFAKAVALTASRIDVTLDDSIELFKRFQRGHLLKVATTKTVFQFDLKDTSKLLPTLLYCAQQKGAAPEIASANPFEVRKDTTTATKDDNASTIAEANIFAANLLSLAGVSNFTLLGPTEHTNIKGQARWYDGSTFGTINVFPTATMNEIKEIGAALIGRDARECKGTYLSGAIPEDSRSAAARVFTTCQVGEKPITAYYLAVRRKAGGAYLISTISLGSEAPAKERDSMLRSAVFKASNTATTD
jgi:hypothetical protein